VSDLPARIGPAEFSPFGDFIAVRCPSNLAPLMRQAGGEWEPGGRCWLIRRRRMGPLIRNLRRATDPLFRRVGINLDQDVRPTSAGRKFANQSPAHAPLA
jgi:hypothetical protein